MSARKNNQIKWPHLAIVSALICLSLSCSDSASHSEVDDAGFDSAEESEAGTGADSAEAHDTETISDRVGDSEVETESETETPSDTETTPSASPWQFAVMGDSRGDLWGVNKDVLSKLVEAVIEKGVELVVFTGDVVDGTVLLRFQMPAWLEIMQPLWDAGIPVYPTRGNHEAVGLNLNALATWQDAFEGDRDLPLNGPIGHDKVTYSAEHKNALFISLDQYVARHRVPQEWLDVQLAEMTVPHLFVFGHEPAYKVQHDDCLDDFPQKRDEFWVSLQSAGARVYFCGHDHFYDHAWIKDGDDDPQNDIHQYIVGTAGAEPRDWSPPYNGNNGGMTIEQLGHVEDYGYVLVTVNGPEVSLTWIGIDGVEGDFWSYTVQ